MLLQGRQIEMEDRHVASSSLRIAFLQAALAKLSGADVSDQHLSKSEGEKRP